jgi:hypothetical protein
MDYRKVRIASQPDANRAIWVRLIEISPKMTKPGGINRA